MSGDRGRLREIGSCHDIRRRRRELCLQTTKQPHRGAIFSLSYCKRKCDGLRKIEQNCVLTMGITNRASRNVREHPLECARRALPRRAPSPMLAREVSKMRRKVHQDMETCEALGESASMREAC